MIKSTWFCIPPAPQVMGDWEMLCAWKYWCKMRIGLIKKKRKRGLRQAVCMIYWRLFKCNIQCVLKQVWHSHWSIRIDNALHAIARLSWMEILMFFCLALIVIFFIIFISLSSLTDIKVSVYPEKNYILYIFFSVPRIADIYIE